MAGRLHAILVAFLFAFVILDVRATPTPQPLTLNGLSLTWVVNSTHIVFTLAGIPASNWAAVGWGAEFMADGLDMCTVHDSVAEDRYATAQLKPPQDAHQDCIWLSTTQQDATSTISVARALKTGDTVADKDITPGPIHVALAFGFYFAPVPGYDGITQHDTPNSKAFTVTLYDAAPAAVTCATYTKCPAGSVRLDTVTCPNKKCTTPKCCQYTCAGYTKCPKTSIRLDTLTCPKNKCTTALCCQATCASLKKCTTGGTSLVNPTQACKSKAKCSATECCFGVCSKYAAKKCGTGFVKKVTTPTDIVCATKTCQKLECCQPKTP